MIGMRKYLLGSLSVYLCLVSGLWLMAAAPLRAAEKSAYEKLKERPITDEVFYFLMNDRFADADPSNNRGDEPAPADGKDSRDAVIKHGYEPTQESFYHGGDLRGIEQKLDYLEGLGVTSLWLSPVMKNRPTQPGESPYGVISGYHGYWITDFTRVDPHLGSEVDFKSLIDAAHKRGMKVFIDVIVNHTADLISYRECQDCPYRSRSDFPYAGERLGKKMNPGFVDGDFSEANFAKLKDPNYAYTPFLSQPKMRKVPEWLNDFRYYHNRGNSTFSGENSELGDFFGLDDLFTEHPQVLAGMIEIYAAWIKKYKFDGFRVDTVKHVNIEFWRAFVPAMHEAARQAGLPHFFIFGEVFSADPAILSQYTRQGKMDAVLDFAFQSAAKDVFADGQTPDRLQDLLAQDDLHRIASSPQKMLTFLSNHDIGRLAYFMKNKFKDASEAELLKRLGQAQAFLFLARGIPVLYYGDEQGFIGFGGDKGAREDMFPSRTPSYASIKAIGSSRKPGSDYFDTSHPLYQATSQLAKVYKQHPALRRGEYTAVRDLGPKMLAFKRSLPEEKLDYLVAFNLDESAAQTISYKGMRVIQGGAIQGDKLAIEALSYAIITLPRSPAQQRVAPLFTNLKDKERVSKFFYAELKAPEGATVSFALKTPQDKAFQELYQDFTPPYRAYVEGYPDGTPLQIKATTQTAGSKAQTTLLSVLIDSRPSAITIAYAAASDDSEVFHVSSSGRIAPSQKLAGDKLYRFAWPLDEESQTLYFSRGSGQKRVYAEPFTLNYREHVLPHLKEGVAPELKLYIDAEKNVTLKASPADAAKAPSPLTTPDAQPMAETKLYLRGGMNSWQTKDMLRYAGQGRYELEVELAPGVVDFKFADADWSAASNFGAPFTAAGLTASGASGNLSVAVPAGAGGRYRFELNFLRNASGANLVFPRIERLK